MLPIFWLETADADLTAITDYIVLYRVAAERIEIVNVVHARQQYPR